MKPKREVNDAICDNENKFKNELNSKNKKQMIFIVNFLLAIELSKQSYFFHKPVGYAF